MACVKRFSIEESKIIEQMLKESHKQRSIAIRLNRSTSGLSSHIALFGGVIGYSSQAYVDHLAKIHHGFCRRIYSTDRDKFIADVKSGITNAELCKKYMVSLRTVQYYKIALRNNGYLDDIPELKIVQDQNDSLLIKRIEVLETQVKMLTDILRQIKQNKKV